MCCVGYNMYCPIYASNQMFSLRMLDVLLLCLGFYPSGVSNYKIDERDGRLLFG